MCLRTWIIGVGVGVAFASSVAIASPTPDLQPGLWSFHTKSTHLSGPKKGKTTTQDNKICLTGENPLEKILNPDLQGQTHCDMFPFKTANSQYRVVMQCENVTQNISGKLLKIFTVEPSHADLGNSSNKGDEADQKAAKSRGQNKSDKNNVLILHGKVRERLTGTPVEAPTVILKETIKGKRIGKCDSS